MRILLLLGMTASLWAQPLDWRPVMRASLERMVASDSKMADYSFDRRVIRKEFEADGKLKLESNMLMRPERVEGVWISRVLEKDGAKLTEVEQRRQEETIRRKILEGKAEGGRPPSILGRDNDDLIQEFPEALEYRLIGEEMMAGRKSWVLACQPRVGYKAKSMRSRFFEKVRGKVWVDQAEKDLVRVDAEVFDTISVGFGLLGRVEKGTRFILNRGRVTEGHFFTESSQVNFTAKVLVFKTLISEIKTQFFNFKLKTAIGPTR